MPYKHYYRRTTCFLFTENVAGSRRQESPPLPVRGRMTGSYAKWRVTRVHKLYLARLQREIAECALDLAEDSSPHLTRFGRDACLGIAARESTVSKRALRT